VFRRILAVSGGARFQNLDKDLLRDSGFAPPRQTRSGLNAARQNVGFERKKAVAVFSETAFFALLI